MKKILLAALAILPYFISCSQKAAMEPANYKDFLKKFIADFNDERWDEIAGNASEEFFSGIPPKKLTEFLSGIKKDFGEITTTRFKYFDKNKSAVYHAELEKTWFNFIFHLDKSNKIIRLVVLPPNYNEYLPMKKNQTEMQLPLEGEWFVFWGGDKEEENYHVISKAQKNAFDLVIVDSSGRSFNTNGKGNEDYYAFGQKLFAPCDGEVISAVDGIADNAPGIMNPLQVTGNSVIIKTVNGEFVLLAHMKLNSVAAKKGEKVKAGQYIGLCGNSGNSSEPHLHLHVMNQPDMKQAAGIKCFFKSLQVNGERKINYSPVKGDRIKRDDN